MITGKNLNQVNHYHHLERVSNIKVNCFNRLIDAVQNKFEICPQLLKLHEFSLPGIAARMLYIRWKTCNHS